MPRFPSRRTLNPSLTAHPARSDNAALLNAQTLTKMKTLLPNKWPLSFLALCAFSPALLHGGDIPPVALVNPFIGTQEAAVSEIKGYWASGCCFPGAATPFGMVQFSPDTVKKIPGGYDYSDNRIKGFSLDHFSGRGYLYMQDIGFMPLIGGLAESPGGAPEHCYANFSHAAESASPGYYKVKLDAGPVVELTATPRTGLARVTFLAESETNTLFVNLANSASGAANSEVHFLSDHELAGWVQAKIGSDTKLYKVWFFTVVDRPFSDSGTWTGPSLAAGAKSAQGRVCGAYVTFTGKTRRTIQFKSGLSFTSPENAVANLQAENGGDKWDFESIRQAAATLWNQKLNVIQLSGNTPERQTVFYTALYHCLFHPNIMDDANGQYAGIDGAVHTVEPGHHEYTHFDGWGLYKTRAPLHGWLFPDIASDMAQSLVNDSLQDAGHGIPRWKQINHNSNGMVGDGNVAVIASLHAFGATRFDTAAALAAMKRNADDPATKSDQHPVRPGLAAYLEKGFVPQDRDGPGAAATTEYAATDMALSYFCRALGDAAGAAKYAARAVNWTNLFNPDSGCLFAKRSDGTWAASNPTSGTGWAEGTSSQYTWAIPPSETSELLKLLGPDKAEARLDDFFTKLDTGPGSSYAYMGNEPCEGAPWIYDFLGRPAKTQKLVRRIELELFTTKPDGYPGQDDGGGLSSWYVFAAMGLYPAVPGAAGFLVGSPLFSDVQIKTTAGQSLRILAPAAADSSPCVSSLKIDGHEHHSLWIPLSSLSGPSPHVLEFKLGPDADTAWGTRPEDAPSKSEF